MRSGTFVDRQLARRTRKCILQAADKSGAECPACGQGFTAGDERVLVYVGYVGDGGGPVWAHVCCVHEVRRQAPWRSTEPGGE